MSAAWRSAYDLTCTALAVALGLAIGWLDLQTTEVTVPILSLLAAGLLLGLLQPIAAWRWAVLVAVGVPAMAAVARTAGLPTAEPARLDPRVALVVLAVALVGCYAGVLVRRTMRAAAAARRSQTTRAPRPGGGELRR